MPYVLRLSKRWAKQWAVRVQDRERLEPPHVHIRRGTAVDVRLSLRTHQFLDSGADNNEVPSALLKEIQEHVHELQVAWDQMYPENPVAMKAD